MKTSNRGISNIVDIDEFLYKQFAKDFVNLYISTGPIAAGNFAVINMEEENYTTASNYIKLEFESRGYTFSEPANMD